MLSESTRASFVAQLVKNLPAMQETGLIPGLGRSPGERKSYLLQYSGLENSMTGERDLQAYSPWCRKELDTTE